MLKASGRKQSSWQLYSDGKKGLQQLQMETNPNGKLPASQKIDG